MRSTTTVWSILAIAAVLSGRSVAEEAVPVTLQLKAKPGASWRDDYTYAAKITRSDAAEPDDESVQEVKVQLSVETTVDSVRKDGRMTLQQKVTRAAQRVSIDGEIQMSFDSGKAGELDKARKDPTLAVLVAIFDSTWKLELESTGEVFDREITVPGGDDDDSLKLVVTGFLDSLTSQVGLLFPGGAVKTGADWAGGPFSRPLPGLGRMTGETTGTLSETREEDGEQVASIRIKRTAKLEPDPDTGVSVEVTEFEEGGTMTLAHGRGRIRLVSLKGTLAYKVKSEQGTFTIRATNELEVREGKP